MARDFQNLIKNGTCKTEADVARHLGTSRARVNQMFKILTLNPDVLEIIELLGDPLNKRIISERALRPLIKQPSENQLKTIKTLLGKE